MNEEAVKQCAELYIQILNDKAPTYPTRAGEISHSHLLWMCEEVTANYNEWDIGKSNRWLGYVAGVLSALHVVSVTEHRDLTRAIFQNVSE